MWPTGCHSDRARGQRAPWSGAGGARTAAGGGPATARSAQLGHPRPAGRHAWPHIHALLEAAMLPTPSSDWNGPASVWAWPLQLSPWSLREQDRRETKRRVTWAS